MAVQQGIDALIEELAACGKGSSGHVAVLQGLGEVGGAQVVDVLIREMNACGRGSSGHVAAAIALGRASRNQ